jgi:hypothetical protein
VITPSKISRSTPAGKKQPYFFYRKDSKPVLFAGIWDMSEVKGDKVPSFAILTDEPNELVMAFAIFNVCTSVPWHRRSSLSLTHV